VFWENCLRRHCIGYGYIPAGCGPLSKITAEIVAFGTAAVHLKCQFDGEVEWNGTFGIRPMLATYHQPI
jgi:hypothetical protein